MPWGVLRRPRDSGAAKVEFAVIVAIFSTWVIVSIAMFQQGVRDAYTAATGETARMAASSQSAAPTSTDSASLTDDRGPHSDVCRVHIDGGFRSAHAGWPQRCPNAPGTRGAHH